MKVIIAGGRDFFDYARLCVYCDYILQDYDMVEIVSGAAGGADRLGERYAKEKRHKLKLFPAEWDTYGKSAGYKRNEEMAKYANGLIAFWDGESKGTKHMIDIAKKHKLKVRVCNYEK